MISALSVRKTTHGNSITKVKARFLHQYQGEGFRVEKKKKKIQTLGFMWFVPDIKQHPGCKKD